MEAFAKRENAFGGQYPKKRNSRVSYFLSLRELLGVGSFSGARRRREFRVRDFCSFRTRTLELVLQYSTGSNSAIGAKNKTQKFADTEENGSEAV